MTWFAEKTVCPTGCGCSCFMTNYSLGPETAGGNSIATSVEGSLSWPWRISLLWCFYLCATVLWREESFPNIHICLALRLQGQSVHIPVCMQEANFPCLQCTMQNNLPSSFIFEWINLAGEVIFNRDLVTQIVIWWDWSNQPWTNHKNPRSCFHITQDMRSFPTIFTVASLCTWLKLNDLHYTHWIDVPLHASLVSDTDEEFDRWLIDEKLESDVSEHVVVSGWLKIVPMAKWCTTW